MTLNSLKQLFCELLSVDIGQLVCTAVYSLQECLAYAVEHNHNLKKAGYDNEKAAYAARRCWALCCRKLAARQT